ncbi:hypothetical protein FJZ19_06115 [Candidatus Pacearchaeota archaeon]|nr:hypothetical protein [Candidatus Pacearchaeota archaeon]
MIDISGINYFLPIFSFLFAFVVVYAILNKTQILGDNAFTQASTAFIIAIIFVSLASARSYIEAVTPWFVALIFIIFFVILIAAFVLAKDSGKILRPGLAWVFIALFALIFVFIFYNHFSIASNSDFIKIKDWVYDEKVSGSVFLLVIALIAGFAIARKVKKD